MDLVKWLRQEADYWANPGRRDKLEQAAKCIEAADKLRESIKPDDGIFVQRDARYPSIIISRAEYDAARNPKDGGK